MTTALLAAGRHARHAAAAVRTCGVVCYYNAIQLINNMRMYNMPAFFVIVARRHHAAAAAEGEELPRCLFGGWWRRVPPVCMPAVTPPTTC